jgi:hypothetical protein
MLVQSELAVGAFQMRLKILNQRVLLSKYGLTCINKFSLKHFLFRTKLIRSKYCLCVGISPGGGFVFPHITICDSVPNNVSAALSQVPFSTTSTCCLNDLFFLLSFPVPSDLIHPSLDLFFFCC